MRKRTSKTPRIVLIHSESQRRTSDSRTIVEALLEIAEFKKISAAALVRELVYSNPHFTKACADLGIQVLP